MPPRPRPFPRSTAASSVGAAGIMVELFLAALAAVRLAARVRRHGARHRLRHHADRRHVHRAVQRQPAAALRRLLHAVGSARHTQSRVRAATRTSATSRSAACWACNRRPRRSPAAEKRRCCSAMRVLAFAYRWFVAGLIVLWAGHYLLLARRAGGCAWRGRQHGDQAADRPVALSQQRAAARAHAYAQHDGRRRRRAAIAGPPVRRPVSVRHARARRGLAARAGTYPRRDRRLRDRSARQGWTGREARRPDPGADGSGPAGRAAAVSRPRSRGSTSSTRARSRAMPRAPNRSPRMRRPSAPSWRRSRSASQPAGGAARPRARW